MCKSQGNCVFVSTFFTDVNVFTIFAYFCISDEWRRLDSLFRVDNKIPFLRMGEDDEATQTRIHAKMRMNDKNVVQLSSFSNCRLKKNRKRAREPVKSRKWIWFSSLD
jgi:hypothetical protein